MCPLLKVGTNCTITSPRTVEYNCLAWAIGITWAWMDPHQFAAGYYWLPGIEREWSMSSIRKTFATVGYTEETDNRELEPGYEKVAIFLEEDGSPLHFAKQLPDGQWTSKLGRGNDISHATLYDLEGSETGYGKVGPILKRQRRDDAEVKPSADRDSAERNEN